MILLVALTAKIPNKNCKCNHKNKPVKQTCPYGELRQVVNCLLGSADAGFSLFIPEFSDFIIPVDKSFYSQISRYEYFGRAPPA